MTLRASQIKIQILERLLEKKGGLDFANSVQGGCQEKRKGLWQKKKRERLDTYFPANSKIIIGKRKEDSQGRKGGDVGNWSSSVEESDSEVGCNLFLQKGVGETSGVAQAKLIESNIVVDLGCGLKVGLDLSDNLQA